jgi:hypothetical protein
MAIVNDILAAFGELETRDDPGTVRAGLRAAKANGKVLGHPGEIFRRDDAVRGWAPWRKIAQQLDVPMSAVIRACSENPPPR